MHSQPTNRNTSKYFLGRLDYNKGAFTSAQIATSKLFIRDSNTYRLAPSSPHNETALEEGAFLHTGKPSSEEELLKSQLLNYSTPPPYWDLGRTNSPTSARRGLGNIRIWATPPKRLVFWDDAPKSFKWYQSHAPNLVVCVSDVRQCRSPNGHSPVTRCRGVTARLLHGVESMEHLT